MIRLLLRLLLAPNHGTWPAKPKRVRSEKMEPVEVVIIEVHPGGERRGARRRGHHN